MLAPLAGGRRTLDFLLPDTIFFPSEGLSPNSTGTLSGAGFASMPSPTSRSEAEGGEAGYGATRMTGVVLGAGKSSRFGEPKQLLPFGDTTLLGQVARNANASKLDEVVVVLGRASEELREALDFGRARVVENTAYGTGCASSLLAGMDAAGECEAIMLLLGDQPGVRTEFIDRSISEWRREKPWASVTSYRAGLLGHPFVFGRGAFGELRSLHGDKAVWKLIEAYPERVSRVGIPAELPPDVDTPEDYEAVLACFERDGS